MGEKRWVSWDPKKSISFRKGETSEVFLADPAQVAHNLVREGSSALALERAAREAAEMIDRLAYKQADYAAAFRETRDEVYVSEAWRVVESEVLERHAFECHGCDRASEAIAVRPMYYPVEKGIVDFMCRHRHYLLLPLCCECCEKHDALHDGEGLPKNGPYIR